MRTIAFDTETCLFRPGVQAPELVCLTWQEAGKPPEIRRWDEAEPILRDWLLDDNVLLTGAHIAFDFCVVGANFPHLLDLIFRKYNLDLVTDIQHRDRLLDVAAGRYQGYHTPKGGWVKPTYALDDLSYRYRGIRLNKPIFDEESGQQLNDSFRLRYNELVYVPLAEWPAEARRYALEDATATLDVHVLQEPHAAEFLGEQFNTARKYFALQLKSVWGLRTNAKQVLELEQKANAERERIRDSLVIPGLVRADGTRDMKVSRAYMVRVCREKGIKVPLTKTGCDRSKTAGMTEDEIDIKYASLAEDACDFTEDMVLQEYADFVRFGTVISKDCKALWKGTEHPIHTRFGMAATLRTTSSKPNTQNWGTGWGPREAFVARPGTCYGQADYPQLELHTLAQTCMTWFGHSKLADTLNRGEDPHARVASVILGWTYEEVIKRKKEDEVKLARQCGKIANFGFPGGLGAENLVKMAKKVYGVVITIERAKLLKQQWMAAFPEMQEYFAVIGSLCNNPSKLGEILIPGSKQIRGGAMFCALSNTPFQGLGAVCAGRALWLLAEAYYVDRKSPLFGCRGVNHIHDENICEIPDYADAHAAAFELARLMDVGANEFLTDVPVKTDPQLMKFWSKEAFALFRNDTLVPWNGEWVCEECKRIFEPPFPVGKKKICQTHANTLAWV